MKKKFASIFCVLGVFVVSVLTVKASDDTHHYSSLQKENYSALIREPGTRDDNGGSICPNDRDCPCWVQQPDGAGILVGYRD